MKLITRNTDYGIRALCFLAKNKDSVVPVTDLVAALRMPRPFLRKILQELTKSGFVRSVRGSAGGFSLAITPDKIYIAEVAKTFQGDFSLNECFLNKALCPNRKACPLKRRIDRIEKIVAKELGAITIGELLKG